MSAVWRGLAKVWPLLRENLYWCIATGNSIYCWKNPWISNVWPLRNHVPCSICLLMDSLLYDMVSMDVMWNLVLFKEWLPEEIVTKIVSIPPPHSSAGIDKIIWAHTSKGTLSLKTSYRMLREGAWNARDKGWEIVWKFQEPQRVRFFLWLVCKQHLLTNLERMRRGISQSTSC